MLLIQSLASGSKGNAVYVASDETRILVDVGLTLRELLRRMESAKIDPNAIDAILITHEHADHVFGLETFIKKYHKKVYLHRDVVGLFENIAPEHIETFGDGKTNTFGIGDIAISYFPVSHDSKFCFGYTFSCGAGKIGFATDLGRTNKEMMSEMCGSQIVMLESNHDLLRLMSNKKYPLVLKQRITSSHGHLSNPASALAIYQLVQSGAKQFILAHLSEQNNSPSLAFNTITDFLRGRGIIEGEDVWIDVATQDKIGIPFAIDNEL